MKQQQEVSGGRNGGRQDYSGVCITVNCGLQQPTLSSF